MSASRVLILLLLCFLALTGALAQQSPRSADSTTPATDSRPPSSDLSYDVHMSDCENRWVALYHGPDDTDYTYGFVYIDPQAGFTLHLGGRFTIGADGKYHVAPDPLALDKAVSSDS